MDANGTLKKLYKTSGIPESLIISKDGIIREKIIGPRNWASSGAVKYFRELSRIN
jgi:predicted regulator of Ras-like GTPase activity (Roadblock/LC7/MglB family)